MEILSTWQYNQGIGRSKLLSSNAGVGSIITTKMGYYILISDINKWDFIKDVQRSLNDIRNEEINDSIRYKKAAQALQKKGLGLVDDLRFVDFIKEEKALSELICLIGIPKISMNEQSNSPNWRDHPINKLLDNQANVENYMVKGTHFPKWFIGKGNQLKTYQEWKKLWIDKNLGSNNFVPPRDANNPVIDKKTNSIRNITINNENEGPRIFPLYGLLTQSNLIFICKNGHLSDIPWAKFLRWKTDMQHPSQMPGNEQAQALFDEVQQSACCSNPNLEWTESTTKSEGYASIFIECRNCGMGSQQPKVNLEGINNLRPNCPGHKPWEIDLSQDNNSPIPSELCFRNGESNNGREQMQVSLVTGNNVYYANGFSSLYIPNSLADKRDPQLIEAVKKLHEKYQRYLKARPGITQDSFWTGLDKDDFIIENGFDPGNIAQFIDQIEIAFLRPPIEETGIDRHENYRYQEYQCFADLEGHKQDGLIFKDVQLSSKLKKYFKKIQQVEELKITQIQLDFTRIKPKERVMVANAIVESTVGKSIYSIAENEVFVLPANETFGEGLFFQFNEEAISTLLSDMDERLQQKYGRFFQQQDLNSQGGVSKQKIFNNGYKQFLIHTFSHLVMKELEFSCGYPTASLKERLYISNRMSGVLIYTAEGSEGSMGGLVWQGQAEKIEGLIINCLVRAVECSSDPLCWESDGQGLFDLNVAACFSCALVSETACEEYNLGLDRRILIDNEFGFFKDEVN